MTYNRVAKPVTIVNNHTFRFNELINQLSHHNLNRKSYTPEFTFGCDPKTLYEGKPPTACGAYLKNYSLAVMTGCR